MKNKICLFKQSVAVVYFTDNNRSYMFQLQESNYSFSTTRLLGILSICKRQNRNALSGSLVLLNDLNPVSLNTGESPQGDCPGASTRRVMV